MKLSGEIKVSLVAALCVVALAFISRYTFHTKLDFISQYGPVWVYVAYLISRNKAGTSKICRSPLFWSLAMILVTIAILALYAP